MRPENLALIFQEILTVIVRVRSGRQKFTDADSFRLQVREALRAAAQDARAKGYGMEDIRMATLAVVGFLDESILNSHNPMFANWPRKTLQHELFDTHMAGETFFENAEQLVRRSDSPELADVLEVHLLCLLLGYSGRYGAAGRGELQRVITTIREKLRRIRGAGGELSPSWKGGPVTVATPRDTKSRWFVVAAVACLALALILFVTFTMSIRSGVDDLVAIPSLRKS